MRELNKADTQRMELEREYSTLKTIHDKMGDTVEKQKRQKEDAHSYESERLKLLRRIDEQSLELGDKVDKIHQLQELLKKERDDRLKISQTLASLQNESDSIEINIRRAQERE